LGDQGTAMQRALRKVAKQKKASEILLNALG
jgi:hypothetical protein